YAAGSGGTGAGILLGIRLLGLPWRAVGVNVCNDKEYFVAAIGEIVEQAIQRWRLTSEFDRSEVEILDGDVGVGYAKSGPGELARRGGRGGGDPGSGLHRQGVPGHAQRAGARSARVRRAHLLHPHRRHLRPVSQGARAGPASLIGATEAGPPARSHRATSSSS